MNKYQLVIFETNRTDGCMSIAEKFYPKDYSEEDRKRDLTEVKKQIGNKYHFNENCILQPYQKDVKFDVDYPDGTYIRVDKNKLIESDYWYEQLPCDILLIDTNNPGIVIGHRMADCPVIIAEDIKEKIVAVSHCGANQINREVPKWTIKALVKEANSHPENIKVYVGSCIKKENYQYDQYPKWATNKKAWEESIIEKENIYYIDLISAIKKQLSEMNIKNENIKISPIDTYSNPDYYSHREVSKNKSKIAGQNFVGCFYKKVD